MKPIHNYTVSRGGIRLSVNTMSKIQNETNSQLENSPYAPAIKCEYYVKDTK